MMYIQTLLETFMRGRFNLLVKQIHDFHVNKCSFQRSGVCLFMYVVAIRLKHAYIVLMIRMTR